MRRPYGAGALAGLLGLAMSAPSPAMAEQNELREFRIGMPIADLPASGYVELACAARPEIRLEAWSEYRRCPAEAETGLHEVSFRYDQTTPLARSNERYAGTKVAGQPMLLSLLIGGDARLDGLRMRTDPEARLFQRRKAFLFGDQVKARFGEEGWTCRSAPPTGEEEAVGGIFIKEHCDKQTADRQFLLERWLYRHEGEELRNFSGGTVLTILRRNG
ncbi:hypothetical protein [Roseicella sp. DB1501]|uniref:hypothetical protein n=1 Tax=Roseicella sp. DB1501 TaxID=2730925 RepID=UPI0014920417|nr:hypothetical protein [Roseicella sp. DB1501]NOG69693.1 hypothetical protein [Roseicella sp. DB1501]